ncbi:hypothetical protein XI00_05760 [Bradyrhizobium sp. CCBAU 21359]|nr:hypothetical protein [Bradyrhizobium sp. CCBAU 21359]
MAFGLHVPDDGLDDRATAQLALDDTEDAALLAGDEDATGILRIVAAVPLVDIGPLDRTAGQRLGTLYDVPQGVPIIRIVGHCARVQHEHSAGSAAIVGDDGGLHADLWTTPALQEESTKG